MSNHHANSLASNRKQAIAIGLSEARRAIELSSADGTLVVRLFRRRSASLQPLPMENNGRLAPDDDDRQNHPLDWYESQES